MTKDETSIVLKAIAALYQTFEVNPMTLNAWFACLKDEDFEEVKSAIVVHARTQKWYPTIADILEILKQNRKSADELMTGWEGWRLWISAIKKFGYYQEVEGLAFLPERIARIGQIIGWKDTCVSPKENTSILRSQFIKAWEADERKMVMDLRLLENTPQKVIGYD